MAQRPFAMLKSGEWMDHYRQKILGIPRGWFVVICGALFYCYQFALRVSPNVMHDELVSDFMIDAVPFFATYMIFCTTMVTLFLLGMLLLGIRTFIEAIR